MVGKQQRMVVVAEGKSSALLLMTMGCRMLLVVLDTCTADHNKYVINYVQYIGMYSFNS